MRLPDGYDPAVQEARRQRAWDRWAGQFPVCSCCGGHIFGGQAFYGLELPKASLILCGDCLEELKDNVCYAEEIEFA